MPGYATLHYAKLGLIQCHVIPHIPGVWINLLHPKFDSSGYPYSFGEASVDMLEAQSFGTFSYLLSALLIVSVMLLC